MTTPTLRTNARKCASFSKNATTLTPLKPQANMAPKKSTERPQYKHHTENEETNRFHSPSPTIHKTLQSKMLFPKTSKLSAMVPKLREHSFLRRGWAGVIAMNMNVKSPGPPFIFGVKKCSPPLGSNKIYSDPPLC